MEGPVDTIAVMNAGGAATRDIPVLGLAGGVASGKSAVARAFASLGWLVIDSDAEVRAKLAEPKVREVLVSWWGTEILGNDGNVDRKKIANRVFADPAERKRLEGLLHPMVQRTRERAQAEARAAGKMGTIIDAPLLFEAGTDRVCDGVVFVDTPWDIRVERAKRQRGWDESEVRRRESAQIPVEEKRRRSRFIVDNTGDEKSLVAQAARICATLGLSASGSASDTGSTP